MKNANHDFPEPYVVTCTVMTALSEQQSKSPKYPVYYHRFDFLVHVLIQLPQRVCKNLFTFTHNLHK